MDRGSPWGNNHTLSHQVGVQPGGKASAGTLIGRAEGLREPNENPRARWNRDRGALRRRAGISGEVIADPVRQHTESEHVDHDADQNLNERCFHTMSPYPENSSNPSPLLDGQHGAALQV